jgi:protein tyrosine phosphatase (PTP) superfamily phosphohydrolase (DUF442 family)
MARTNRHRGFTLTITGRRIFGAAFWAGPLLLGFASVSIATNWQERSAALQTPAKDETNSPQRISILGIENTFRLSPRLYSGGDPHGVESFSALKDLGIRTIISVDGASPDVEAARKLGIRYVHLPIGYDGVPREQAVKLVQAVKTLPGPVYVHCHHGKHRGPASAAICGIAVEGWTKEQAIAWMELAGTSPDYRGLFTSAREFVPPSKEELKRFGAELPERATVPDLVEMMVQVDERWDHLKAAQKVGFQKPVDQPDVDPPHEALQLMELFREAGRLPETKERGELFLTTMGMAETNSAKLEKALRTLAQGTTDDSKKVAEAAFQSVAKVCTTCHASYRDNRSPR